MNLSTALGRALDALIAPDGPLAGFGKLPGSGQDQRRYFSETAFAQREVVFYRDKWWTRAGGVLSLELMVLVPELQLALAGRPQSLAAPDPEVPFTSFQYTTAVGPTPTWTVASAEDASRAAEGAAEWLRAEGVPWMASLDSMDGVVRSLERTGGFHRLARLHAALGDRVAARAAVVAWLRTLPRQTDRALAELERAGVLASGEVPALRVASLQREEVYAAEVEAWLAAAASP
jgi:hypothetical protein